MSESNCTVEGCMRKREARGWCAMHYQRWQHHGNPLGERGNGETAPEHVAESQESRRLQNAAESSAESRRASKEQPTVIDWDRAIKRWLAMMEEIYCEHAIRGAGRLRGTVRMTSRRGHE